MYRPEVYRRLLFRPKPKAEAEEIKVDDSSESEDENDRNRLNELDDDFIDQLMSDAHDE